MTILYASCVEYMNTGLLLCGETGSGKSDLCLRLIDNGANLVSDDRTLLENSNGVLKARAPASIQGLLEIRGIGIVEMPFVEETAVSLKLNLKPAERIERMPEYRTEKIENIEIPVFDLDAFSASVITKIKTLLLILNNKRKLVG